jgi:hypothetical protein
MKAWIICLACLAYFSALGGILLWISIGSGSTPNADIASRAPYAGLIIWWISAILANLLAARYATPHTRRRTALSILTAVALLLPPLLAYGAPLHFALGGSEVIESATGATLPAAAPGGISIVIEGLTYGVAALGLLEMGALLLLPLFPLITAFQAPARQHHLYSEALGEPMIEHEHAVGEHVTVEGVGEPVMLSETHSTSTPY